MNDQYSNKASKISLFLGISSIPLLPFLIPSIAGLICGIKGIKKANQQAGYGKVPSLIGLILSSLSLFGFMLIIPIMIFMDSVSPLAKTINKGVTHENENRSHQQNQLQETTQISTIYDKKNSEINNSQFDFSEQDQKSARYWQVKLGIYTKSDIMSLHISEEERKELLKIHEETKSEKIKELNRQEEKRVNKEEDKKAFEEKLSRMTPDEKANYIFAKLKKGYSAIIEIAIKENMHDPDTFEFVSFTGQPLKVESGRTDIKVIYKFRGKNALGAKVLNSLECKINTDTGALYDIQNPKAGE